MKRLVLILALLPWIAGAETITETIRNINKAFYADEKVSMTMETHVYRDGKEQAAEPATHVYRLSTNFLYRTTFAESLLNGTYLVNVDHRRKTIMVSPALKSKANADPMKVLSSRLDFTEVLDSLLSFYKHVDIKSVNENTNELSFEFKSGAYESITVRYNVKSYRTESISIYMRPAQEGKKPGKHQYQYVIKNNYEHAGSVSKRVFEESQYFTVKKGAIVPIGKYKDYAIINNLTKKSKSA